MLKRLAVLGWVLGALAPGPALAAPLEQYEGTVAPRTVEELRRSGHDVRVEAVAGRGARVELVLSAREAAGLRARGVALRLTRTPSSLSASRHAARQAAAGFVVWRSFSEPGGIRDELVALAEANPSTAKLVPLGRSVQGKDVLALKVTRDASAVPDGSRPAVLYSSMQHAREWITVEVNRRLLRHVLDGDGRDPEITRLLDTRELWFVLVANPDGYDHTFASPDNRLWRKNLRDNDGDATIGSGDGVDLNRNFETRWGYDDEGSSSEPESENFRGAAPASEPETRALDDLLRDIRPRFHLNYHSVGPQLFYPFGWQVQSPPADEPIFTALAGTDERPAIEGYDTGVSADLYITNGETMDHAYSRYGILAFLVELDEGCPNCGFVFPDDPALVEAEFRRNLPFALDLARSAATPDQPSSHLGLVPPALVAEPFPLSYGDPQPVQALAARRLGPVTLRYRVNGGDPLSSPTVEWDGGERYGADGDVAYSQVRGSVGGTAPGDRVEAWFEAGGQESAHFTYEAALESGARVLVLAAEDYTGAAPDQPPGPRHLSAHLDALAANGIAADVYDVDARGRRAPDPLGVLSHYDAVVWYTGDDRVTREPWQADGSGASRLANDLMLALRDFVNEGGRLLHAGDHAGLQYDEALPYPAEGEGPCAEDADCVSLSNDFLQYWLGSYDLVPGVGARPDGGLFDAVGVGEPLQGLELGFAASGGVDAGDRTATHVVTSSVLPVERFPQFRSWESVNWRRPGGPFEPLTGVWYVHSDRADASYKRLARVVDLSGAAGGTLAFNVSYDMERDWDWLFVEAREVGTEGWTTLPDSGGDTSRETGESCSDGWQELHPALARYQTEQRGPDGAITGCTPTGTTGEWHAATGDSRGWREWRIDLSRWAGKRVEVAIAYVSDWSIQGLGVFVDDVRVTEGDSAEATSWEEGLGPWEVLGAPAGSGPNATDWRRTGTVFEEGAGVSTPDTLLLGFGLERLSTPELRATVMGRAMSYLLRGRQG